VCWQGALPSSPSEALVHALLYARFWVGVRGVTRDIYEDTRRLVVSSGEPEVVLRDAIFKNVCVISPKRGFCFRELGLIGGWLEGWRVSRLTRSQVRGHELLEFGRSPWLKRCVMGARCFRRVSRRHQASLTRRGERRAMPGPGLERPG
jgi:hypothetical protein